MKPGLGIASPFVDRGECDFVAKLFHSLVMPFEASFMLSMINRNSVYFTARFQLLWRLRVQYALLLDVFLDGAGFARLLTRLAKGPLFCFDGAFVGCEWKGLNALDIYQNGGGAFGRAIITHCLPVAGGFTGACCGRWR